MRRALIVVLVCTTCLLVVTWRAGVRSPSRSSSCRSTDVPIARTNALDQHLDPIVGADYQRAFALDGGRLLWVFQDAFVDDGVGDPTLVHNAAVLDDGCMTVILGGSDSAPEAWVTDATTVPMQHWYWPLGGYQSDPETFVLFLADMVERGDHYLSHTEPVGTKMVEIDLDDMSHGATADAPGSSQRLYGWSIVEDSSYRYLFGYCYRQFGWSWTGHDECSDDVYIARQPRPGSSVPLTYWDGGSWNPAPESAVDISPTNAPSGAQRGVDPMQVAPASDGTWRAVTKVGDWYGDSLYFDVAPAPQGPWTTTAVIPATMLGVSSDAEVNNYFATIVPDSHAGATIAISSNCWSDPACDAYEPTVRWAPDKLWAHRQPVQVSDGVYLPLGPELEGF